jgi:transposase
MGWSIVRVEGPRRIDVELFTMPLCLKLAAKRSRNFSQQKLTIGLDLGDRSSHYCVVDEGGRILVESKVSTSPKAIEAVFGSMGRSRIALETGMHSPWVSRLLSGLGHEVIVHARKVCLIGESRRKDDRLDAQTLARLADRSRVAVSGEASQRESAGRSDGDSGASGIRCERGPRW